MPSVYIAKELVRLVHDAMPYLPQEYSLDFWSDDMVHYQIIACGYPFELSIYPGELAGDFDEFSSKYLAPMARQAIWEVPRTECVWMT